MGSIINGIPKIQLLIIDFRLLVSYRNRIYCHHYNCESLNPFSSRIVDYIFGSVTMHLAVIWHTNSVALSAGCQLDVD